MPSARASWNTSHTVSRSSSALKRLPDLERQCGNIFSSLQKSRLNPSSFEGESSSAAYAVVELGLPKTGEVVGWIDCKGLLPMKDFIPEHTDVLNGIAYDPATKRLWLTGKFWPKVFEVKLVKR